MRDGLAEEPRQIVPWIPTTSLGQSLTRAKALVSSANEP